MSEKIFGMYDVDVAPRRQLDTVPIVLENADGSHEMVEMRPADVTNIIARPRYVPYGGAGVLDPSAGVFSGVRMEYTRYQIAGFDVRTGHKLYKETGSDPGPERKYCPRCSTKDVRVLMREHPAGWSCATCGHFEVKAGAPTPPFWRAGEGPFCPRCRRFGHERRMAITFESWVCECGFRV